MQLDPLSFQCAKPRSHLSERAEAFARRMIEHSGRPSPLSLESKDRQEVRWPKRWLSGTLSGYQKIRFGDTAVETQIAPE